MEPTIALVFSPERWVETLHRHLTDHGGARVRQIVLEPALALADEYDTLVVSHRWPGLTRSFVEAVHLRSRCVLGVFDPTEAAGREHLAALGVDATIRSDAAVSEFVQLVTELTPARVDGPRDRATADPESERIGPTVVSGPAGAGTSEIALGLTGAIATRGEDVVLVDADEVASSTAARLGLAIEPNLRSAIDAVEHGLGDLATALVRCGPAAVDIVCGLPSLAAVAQIRPRDVLTVISAVSDLRSQVVVEVSGTPGMEIARAVVGEAGVLVGVGSANPVGVARLLGWAAALPAGAVAPHFVLNRAPTDRYRGAELTAEIYRTFTPASLTFVPSDRRVERAAWEGELVPRGPFTAGVAALAQTAVPRRARPRRAGAAVAPNETSGMRSDVMRGNVVSRDAYEGIRRDVLARIERRQLRPEGDLDEVRVEVHRAVDEYERRARLGEELPLVSPAVMVDRVLRSITDFGPMTDLIARRDVEEIFLEGGRVSYLDASGHLRGLTVPTSEDENRQMIERLLAPTDRQLNAKHPMVQARVLDGTAWLTAAIPPVGDRLSATLRRYVVRNVTLDDLTTRDSLSREAAAFLGALMQLRSRVAVSGEPGAGKTTLAAALLAAAPPGHCVRSCEEIRELAVPITHGSYYEVRPPALDGTGEISMRDLVKFVLAMRPDRIVVGEVRGAEAFELSRAVNAGCGFLCTVHANSAAEALDALVNAALMAGENVTERIVRKVFSESLDVVIHVDRDDMVNGDAQTLRRHVMEIAAVVPALRDDFTIEPLFVRDEVGAPLRWTGALPSRLEARLARVVPSASLHAMMSGGEQRS